MASKLPNIGGFRGLHDIVPYVTWEILGDQTTYNYINGFVLYKNKVYCNRSIKNKELRSQLHNCG